MHSKNKPSERKTETDAFLDNEKNGNRDSAGEGTVNMIHRKSSAMRAGAFLECVPEIGQGHCQYVYNKKVPTGYRIDLRIGDCTLPLLS